MHEFSIAESMLDLIESALHGARPLDRVDVTIGPLSGISPEALSFCFSEIARSRGFGEPELAIRRVDARLICTDCGREYETSDFYCFCPACGSMNRRILSGREFTVESVEFEEDDEEEDSPPSSGKHDGGAGGT